MKVIEVEYLIKNEGTDDEIMVGFISEDGKHKFTIFDGCDWKENPADLLVKMMKKLKKGDEIVELADGSDTLWYGILRAKIPKSKAKGKKRK